MNRTLTMGACLAAAVLGASPALAAPKAEPVEWTLDGETFRGVLVYDDDHDGPRPGLVMVPNWRGVNDSAVEKAQRAAGDEYVVLVADVYGRDVRPRNDEEAGPVAAALRADRPLLRQRARKALEVLQARPEVDAGRVGAFGFCFGGTTVLELARDGAPLAGVVSLHGGLSTPLPAGGEVGPAVLVLNGAADRGVSAEDIAGFQREMDAANADWQFVNFADAVHCFAEEDAANPPGCVYHERSARRAWRMMDDFFEERFEAPARPAAAQ